MKNPISQYIDLLSRFVEGELEPSDFQNIYLTKFKNETYIFDESTYGVLDTLFGDVDAFTTNRELAKESPKDYLEEGALRMKVRQALAELWAKREV